MEFSNESSLKEDIEQAKADIKKKNAVLEKLTQVSKLEKDEESLKTKLGTINKEKKDAEKNHDKAKEQASASAQLLNNLIGAKPFVSAVRETRNRVSALEKREAALIKRAEKGKLVISFNFLFSQFFFKILDSKNSRKSQINRLFRGKIDFFLKISFENFLKVLSTIKKNL